MPNFFITCANFSLRSTGSAPQSQFPCFFELEHLWNSAIFLKKLAVFLESDGLQGLLSRLVGDPTAAKQPITVIEHRSLSRARDMMATLKT